MFCLNLPNGRRKALFIHKENFYRSVYKKATDRLVYPVQPVPPFRGGGGWSAYIILPFLYPV